MRQRVAFLTVKELWIKEKWQTKGLPDKRPSTAAHTRGVLGALRVSPADSQHAVQVPPCSHPTGENAACRAGKRRARAPGWPHGRAGASTSGNPS